MRKGRTQEVLSWLDSLEGSKGSGSPFTPSPELFEKIHNQWMAGRPDKNAFVVHRRADPDEIVARILLIVTEAGQRLLPGVSFKTPVLFTNTSRDFADCPEGKVFLGIGDIGFNEHKLPPEIRESICCADMTAKYLGVDQDLTLLPLIEAAKLDDLHAGSPPDSLAQMIKRAYRLGESSESVMNWATEKFVEWYRVLSSQPNKEEVCPEVLEESLCVEGYKLLIDNEEFPDVEKNGSEKIRRSLSLTPPRPDSLIRIMFRSYVLNKPIEEVRQWGQERIRQWEEDEQNSSHEVIQPELERCGELRPVEIGHKTVLIAIIRTERLSNQKYKEYVARFTRRRKGWNATVTIQVDEKGNTLIFPNESHKVRLDSVIAYLINQEGYIWHGQFNTAMNGSLKYDQPPTKFTTEQLVEIVSRLAWIE